MGGITGGARRTALLGSLVLGLAGLLTPLGASAQWLEAASVSFDLPATDIVNRSNVAFLVFGGSCSNAGEQVAVTGPGGFSATAQCQPIGRWELSNVSLTQQSEGLLAFTASHGGTATATRTLRKDTVAPLLTLQQPTNGSTIDASNQQSVLVRGTCGELSQPVTVRARPAVATSPVIERQLTCLSSRSFSTTLDVSGLPDGDTQILVQHRDVAGNTAQQDIILFKDTVPLEVTMASLGGYIPASRSASLQPQGTCNKPGEALYLDVTGPSGYMVSLFTLCSWDGTWSFPNVSVTDAPDEELTFTAILTYSLTGASVSTQRTAIKDVVPPVVTVLTPAPGTRVTSATGTSLQVSGTCSEPTPVSVATAEGAPVEAPCQEGTFSVRYELAGFAEGDVAFRSVQADLAGNTGRQDFSLLKDTQPASVSVLSPAPGGFVNVATAPAFLFTGTCSEHGAFAEPVRLEGAVSAFALCVAGSWNVMLSLAELPEGPLSVRVSHQDTAGNPPAEVLLTLVKDVTPPVLQLTSPSPEPGQPQVLVNAANLDTVKILGTCSESGQALTVSGAVTGTAACNGGTFEYTPLLSGAADGDVLLHFTLTDAAGNSATQSLGLYKDTLPPNLTLAGGDPLPLTATTAPDLLLTGACSEHGQFAAPVRVVSPVAALAACNSGTWSLKVSLTELSDGTGTLKLEHTDRAGNVARLSRAYLKDTVPPMLSITQPGPGFYINASTVASVRVIGTCNEPGRSVEISGPVSATAPCSGGAFSTYVNLTGAPEGDVTLRTRLTDAVGNETVQDVRVLKDTVLPTLALTNVGDPIILNAASTGELYLLGTCSEHSSGVKLVSPVAATAACTGATWSLLVSLSNLTDGTGTLVLEHQDVAGNAARLYRSYRKDTVAPTLALTRPAPGDYINAATVQAVPVSGTCNENGRPVEVTHPVAASASCSAGKFSLTVNLSSVPEGSVTLRTRLTDAAGNETRQDAIVLKDTVLPTLTLANAGTLEVPNAPGSALVLSGTCSESNPAWPVLLTSPVTGTAACNAGTWSLQVDSGSLPEGEGSLRFTHADAAGNTAQLVRAYLKAPPVPVLTLAGLASGGSIPARPVLTGTCSEKGRAVELLSPVTLTATCSTSGTFTLSPVLTSIADGPVTLRLRHTNALGRSTELELALTKDSVVPTVSLTQPVASDLGQSTAIALAGTCSEPGRPVTFKNGVVGEAVCTEAKTFAVTLPLTVLGVFTVDVEHRDAAGNLATARRTFERCQYPARVSQPQVAGTGTLVRADFNADGVGDVAMLGIRASPEGVRVYLGRAAPASGTSSFEAPVLLPTTSPDWLYEASLTAADFNADGALDLLVTGSSSGPYAGASLFTGRLVNGRPSGAFNAAVLFPELGASFAEVLPADLNGDGLLDAVMAQTKTSVSVAYARQACGPGVAFDPPVTVHQSPTSENGRPLEYEGMTVADMNGDGRSDIVLAGFYGTLDVLLRTSTVGAPAFQRFPAGRSDLDFYGLRKVIASDLNGDGRMDLAGVAHFSGYATLVTYGLGGGSFTPLTKYPVGELPVDITAADVDANGRRDLIVGSAVGITVFPGQPSSAPGGYAFGAGRGLSTARSVSGHAMMDVNADGILDVVASEDDGRQLGTYPRSTAALEPEPFHAPTVYGAPNETVWHVASADFDADGILDLATASQQGLGILRGGGTGGVGNGTFSPLVKYPGFEAYRLLTADFNEDGAIDIAGLGESSVGIFLGNRSGTFAAPGVYSLGGLEANMFNEALRQFYTGDLDGDGVLDLVAAYSVRNSSGSDTTTLSVHFGQGSAGRGYGTFEPVRLVPLPVEATQFIVRDFNPDGRADLALSVYFYDQALSRYRYEVQVLSGTGNRAAPFGAPTIYTVENGPDSLVAGDFNADGVLDLLPQAFQQLRPGIVLLGTPAGGFTPTAFMVGGTFGEAPIAEDYNRDGALDVISMQKGRLNLLRRTSGPLGGRMTSHFIYPAVSSFEVGFTAKDFNEDGLLDVAFTHGGVHVMLGRP